MEKRKEEQERLQLEIKKINEDNRLAKELKKEEERLADLDAMEYTNKKLVSEAFTHFSGMFVFLCFHIC